MMCATKPQQWHSGRAPGSTSVPARKPPLTRGWPGSVGTYGGCDFKAWRGGRCGTRVGGEKPSGRDPQTGGVRLGRGAGGRIRKRWGVPFFMIFSVDHFGCVRALVAANPWWFLLILHPVTTPSRTLHLRNNYGPLEMTRIYKTNRPERQQTKSS